MAAWSWSARTSGRPGGADTIVATETCVHAMDGTARRRFARYWLVVGPFSALIRRRMLAVVRTNAMRKRDAKR
jgi:hypothetical protein